MKDIGTAEIHTPQMRHAGRDWLSLALMDARNHTLRWINVFEAALAADGWRVPQLAEVNPPLWELGHIGWFQEAWIARNVQRNRGPACDPVAPRLASIEPQADRWYDSSHVPHDTRWSLDLPDFEATKKYLADSIEITLDMLATAEPGDDALYFYRLVLFHEDMHGEAFAITAQTLGLPLSDAPELQEALQPRTMAPREPLLFPATRWSMGSADSGFVFDNERLPHEVQVPEFEIDAQPVSWGQYCEFVEDGGYDEPQWWSPEGWAWIEREGRRTPRHVTQMRQAVLMQRFGSAVRVPLAQPVMHVSFHEAQAWCRWAGRRLPSEPEWEIAAHQGVARGFRWGDVWEWTAGSFRPYPGFEPHPYRDYSQPWFNTHRVLRGASLATRGRLRDPKFRNFYLPERDDIFVGFRSCSL
ncbi:selenoneine synthase SenA [Piscinibacter sakaiensis]|uniref:selenoneine synthase SenA n=1 Tax=Piscinibacter sakaiensis TaxID=1547922 RepID=UPI003AAEA884